MDKTSGPRLGEVVTYRLTENDAIQINRRRTSGTKIAEGIAAGKWPLGAQAHIGNEVKAGERYPMIIVHAWGGTYVNGQVMLDGNDTLWVTSVMLGDEPGNWQFREEEVSKEEASVGRGN